MAKMFFQRLVCEFLLCLFHCSYVIFPCFMHIFNTMVSFKKRHLTILFEG